MLTKGNVLLSQLQVTVDNLLQEFELIGVDRRDELTNFARFMQRRVDLNLPLLLNFICTHNSRRSHLAQLWAQASALYFNIPGVLTFSGGTEATAFNSLAVNAMRKIGFSIAVTKAGSNPTYEVRYSEAAGPMLVFSKRYDDPENVQHDFIAVMTCSHADDNCPVVAGAIERVVLTYDDPKDFDGTPMEDEKYLERAHQIGREMLFLFSLIRAPYTPPRSSLAF